MAAYPSQALDGGSQEGTSNIVNCPDGLAVVSVQVDTEGAVAKDDFFVTYHGEPLNPSMTCLVTNALQYYLQLAEVEREESY